MFIKRRRETERQDERPATEPREPLTDEHFAPLRNELADILNIDPDELKPRD